MLLNSANEIPLLLLLLWLLWLLFWWWEERGCIVDEWAGLVRGKEEEEEEEEEECNAETFIVANFCPTWEGLASFTTRCPTLDMVEECRARIRCTMERASSTVSTRLIKLLGCRRSGGGGSIGVIMGVDDNVG